MIVFKLPGETAQTKDLWLFTGVDSEGKSVERVWLGGEMRWMEAHWTHSTGATLNFQISLDRLLDIQAAVRELPVWSTQGRQRPAWDPQEDRIFLCKTQSNESVERIRGGDIVEVIVEVLRKHVGDVIEFCIEEEAFDAKIQRMQAALDHPQWEGVDEDLRHAHLPRVEIDRVGARIQEEFA